LLEIVSNFNLNKFLNNKKFMKLFRYDKHYNYKKIYKEKMKDRHKINGIKFDYSKREVKKYLLSSNNEKSQEKLWEKNLPKFLPINYKCNN
jgi:hypothetical protein